MKKIAGALIAFLLLTVPPQTYGADETDPIDFDIYRQDSLMVVWADLSSLITSRRITQMKEGIDLAFEYRLSLLRPKRLWGSHKAAQVDGIVHLGYRVITEDYFLTRPTSDPPPDKRFLTLGELHKFLADSITIELACLDSLDENKRYSIQMALTCVSLTSLNLAEESDGEQSGESAVRWLFKEFLDLTNFGRQDYAFESRLFSLSELAPRP